MNKLATSITILALLIVCYLVNLWIYPETVHDLQVVANAVSTNTR